MAHHFNIQSLGLPPLSGQFFFLVVRLTKTSQGMKMRTKCPSYKGASNPHAPYKWYALHVPPFETLHYWTVTHISKMNKQMRKASLDFKENPLPTIWTITCQWHPHSTNQVIKLFAIHREHSGGGEEGQWQWQETSSMKIYTASQQRIAISGNGDHELCHRHAVTSAGLGLLAACMARTEDCRQLTFWSTPNDKRQKSIVSYGTYIWIGYSLELANMPSFLGPWTLPLSIGFTC